jgi:outer membrane lipoprotein-sorting protein
MLPLLALPFLLLAPAAAHNATQITADEVVAKWLAGTGGYARIKAVQSLKLTGTYTTGEAAPVPYVMYRRRPNLYRWDRNVTGPTLVVAFNGKVTWWINPQGPRPVAEEMGADDARNVQGDATFEDELIDARQKGNRVELLGTDDVDGRAAYKLKVTRKDGGVERFYIDTQTFLKVKHSLVFSFSGREYELDTFYGDYKPVEGVLFAHHIEREFGGQHRVMIVKAIEVNRPIDGAVFDMPKGAPK